MPPMRGRPLSPEMQATLDAIRSRFTAPANPYEGHGHVDPNTGQWISEGPGPDLLAGFLGRQSPGAQAAIARQRALGGASPQNLAASRWNYAMLQYLSGRGPHPGPHPIGGTDPNYGYRPPAAAPVTAPDPVPVQPTPTPTPTPDPGGGYGPVPPPGSNVSGPGGPFIDPEYTGPPDYGYTNVPLPQTPVGPTYVPPNPGPLGPSALAPATGMNPGGPGGPMAAAYHPPMTGPYVPQPPPGANVPRTYNPTGDTFAGGPRRTGQNLSGGGTSYLNYLIGR